ncbi:hypothetical protein D4R75_13185, partial [bacterium]
GMTAMDWTSDWAQLCCRKENEFRDRRRLKRKKSLLCRWLFGLPRVPLYKTCKIDILRTTP